MEILGFLYGYLCNQLYSTVHMRSTIILIVFLSITLPATAQNEIRIPVTDFDPSKKETGIDEGKWEVLQFKKTKATDYQLIQQNKESSHIVAISDGSASGLIYQVDIDPKEYSTIEWTWKVDATIERSSLTEKKGDDFPARIFVTFDYSPSQLSFGDKLKYFAIKTFSRHDIPLRALTYVWAHEEETNSIQPNPFSKWVYSVAAQSGSEHTGTWQLELRNIYEDYKKAFGEEPMRITGVAIMTDTDNTKEMAKGYYGDIIFKKTSER